MKLFCRIFNEDVCILFFELLAVLKN